MHTDELTKILTAAASTVDVRPGFTDRVREGGRRRRRRRRLAIVAAALSTAGLLGFGSLTWEFLSRLPADVIAADARFSQSALGGRAADEALQTDARAVFTRDWPRSPAASGVRLVGSPHVYWAGDTAGGPAVVLLHRANRGDQELTLIALTGKDARTGQTRLLGVRVPERQEQRTALFQFGEDNRQLLGVGEHELTWSYFTLGVGGGFSRTTQTTPVGDGVVLAGLPLTAPTQRALVSLPEQGTRWLPGEVADVTATHPEGLSSGLGGVTLPEASIRAEPLRSLAEGALGSFFDPLVTPAKPNWTLATGLRDGRSLYLAELPTLGAPPRLVGVVFDRDAAVDSTVSGWTELGSSPSAHVRLPGEEGWLVLAPKGKLLRWSAAVAPYAWQDAGTEGWAILPAGAGVFTVGTEDAPGRTVQLR